MLFGKLPTTSINEALSDMLEAKRLFDLQNHSKKGVYLYLAKCYKEMDNQEKANEFLNLADKLPNKNIEDRLDQLEVDTMLDRN